MSDGNFCRFCGDPALIDQIATLQSRLTAKEAENARLREAARWIPVSERLPEYGVPVLVTDGVDSIGHARHRTTWRTTSWWQIVASNDEVSESDVTHWMPLPSPPGC